MTPKSFNEVVRRVGKAKRAHHSTASLRRIGGHVAALLCPPYYFLPGRAAIDRGATTCQAAFLLSSYVQIKSRFVYKSPSTT